MDILVTYDISTATKSGQRRLQRVAKICEGYGVRIQYSVFECRLSSASHQRLINDLTDAIDPAVDSVHLYRFPGPLHLARQTIGLRPAITVADPWIV